jgi:hypothetical protein
MINKRKKKRGKKKLSLWEGRSREGGGQISKSKN